MSRELGEELVRMAETVRAGRAALSSDTSLFEYHPMMVELSRRNADRQETVAEWARSVVWR
jgi:hypothetical protein